MAAFQDEVPPFALMKYALRLQRLYSNCMKWKCDYLIGHRISSPGKTQSVYIQTDLPIRFTSWTFFSKYISSDICKQLYESISWSPTRKKHGIEGEKQTKSIKMWWKSVTKGSLLAQLEEWIFKQINIFAFWKT